MPFFAELENHVRQFALVRPRDQICSGFAGVSVHAHVERFIALKTESTTWSLELQGGNSQVGEGTINERHTQTIQDRVNRTEVSVNEVDALRPRRQGLSSAIESIQVAVQSDDSVGARCQQGARVTAEPHGAVDEYTAAFRSQLLHHFRGHDGLMVRQIPNSESARASSSVYGSR
jgi:hypothetical protein